MKVEFNKMSNTFDICPFTGQIWGYLKKKQFGLYLRELRSQRHGFGYGCKCHKYVLYE